MSETCCLCQSLCSLGMTVNLRGLVGDCGKEFVIPDRLQCRQCLCGVCGQGVWRKKDGMLESRPLDNKQANSGIRRR